MSYYVVMEWNGEEYDDYRVTPIFVSEDLESAYNYVEEHGTCQGWLGRTPVWEAYTIEEFDPRYAAIYVFDKHHNLIKDGQTIIISHKPPEPK